MRFVIGLLLSTVFLSSSGFAQEIELSIKLGSDRIVRTANKVPVIVTITNKSGADIRLDLLNYLTFNISRYPIGGQYNTNTDRYHATGSFKKKGLAAGKSLSFTLNLVKMFWWPYMSSIYPIDAGPNFREIPEYMRYLHAKTYIPLPSKKVSVGGRIEEIPQSRTIVSNEVEFQIVRRQSK
ncbi:MAG: hypothetical protein IPN69_05610 [Acidobacteria bacterium]|nr:hypothetical protein [Acidobacteriota bacterium]MBK8810195.1 hypothetical protein [Acidobacteriota bacterium]